VLLTVLNNAPDSTWLFEKTFLDKGGKSCLSSRARRRSSCTRRSLSWNRTVC